MMHLVHFHQRFPHLSQAWLKITGTNPQDAAILREQIQSHLLQRSGFTHREVLADSLIRQYGKEIHPNALTNIHALKEEQTYTVTTGHQICLLGGPSFSMYKILTTIRLSQELNKENSGKKIVPVFWMATEDHDKAEIASVAMFGKEIIWETKQEGAVGRFSTDDLSTFLDQVRELKGNFPNSESISELFLSCYAPGQTLATATRRWMNALFGHLGLVIIDGDDAALKSLFTPVIEEEILSGPVSKLVATANQQLEEQGIEPQVHPREINFFYLEHQSRKRIVRSEDGGFTLHEGNKKWTEAEIRSEIHSHPENFSPNVLLRPLYQECILPNVAYIGGPGELSYWIQLPVVFSHFKIPMPVMFPRNSVMMIDKGQRSRMEKLGITEQDLFHSSDELVKSFLEKNAGEEIDLSAYRNKIESVFSEMAEHAAKIDSTLKPAVLGELQKEIKFVESLEGRIRKAEKQKHDTSVNQIRGLKDKLFPEGTAQERIECFLPWLWRDGIAVIDECGKHLNPFDLRYHFLLLD